MIGLFYFIGNTACTEVSDYKNTGKIEKFYNITIRLYLLLKNVFHPNTKEANAYTYIMVICYRTCVHY